MSLVNSSVIRALVVDDEPLARTNVMVLLRLDPEIEIIGECRSGTEAVEAIRRETSGPRVLDVQMPECDGFDVNRAARKGSAPRCCLCDSVRQTCLESLLKSARSIIC